VLGKAVGDDVRKRRARRHHRCAVDVLENDVLENERDGRAAVHAGPIGRADAGVVDENLGGHVARSDEAALEHVLGGEDACREATRAAKGVAEGNDVRDARRAIGAASHDHGKLRRGRRKRGVARKPLDVADVLASAALLDVDVAHLAAASVHAKRQEGVVHRVALFVEGRQALGALEADGRRVLLEVLGLLRSEEVLAVRDEEAVKVAVKDAQAVPDLLVDLHADGHLVFRHDVGD